MHIVYLVFSTREISGGTRVIFEHVNGLARLGHRVEVWKTSENDEPYFESKVPVKTYNVEQLDEPDVVVMTDTGFLPEVLLHRKKRGTFLLIQHDNEWISEITGSSTSAGLVKENKEYFEKGHCQIIVVSNWLQELVKQKYGLDSLVILNGVDRDIFHPDEPIIQMAEPLALIFYDPQEWKGYGEATLALLEARKKLPSLQIAIVGRYFPETPEVEGMSYGFPFPVIYFNRPEQNKLSKIFSSASVFVTTSWKEGFGLPGLEAMACGVPVVTTDSLGNRDYAISEETAVLVPQKDVVKISEGIVRVLADDKLRKRLKHNGMKKAQELDWDSSIKKLEEKFTKTMLKA